MDEPVFIPNPLVYPSSFSQLLFLDQKPSDSLFTLLKNYLYSSPLPVILFFQSSLKKTG
jgi:hypothetical protein